jgi:hypothetical protein
MAGLGELIVGAPDHAHTAHPVWMLRVPRERPSNCRAAKKGDEITPPHASPPIPAQPKNQMLNANTKAIAASQSVQARDVC